jgi:hypothetical protein
MLDSLLGCVRGKLPAISYANVTATLALIVALSGGAYAATSLSGADGTIKGCVAKRGKAKGALRVVSTKARCRRGEQTITWNKSGGPGVAGAPGPQGPQGPAGGQGPPGERGAAGSDANFAGAPASGDLEGTYPGPQIRGGAVGGPEVAPDSLTGDDIAESQLGRVPEADAVDGISSESLAQVQTNMTSPSLQAGFLRTSGVRLGSETIASPPAYPAGSPGLVVRRVVSDDVTSGTVVARTDTLALERDGTAGGLRIRSTAPLGERVSCFGLNNSAVSENRNIFVSASSTVGVYTDAAAVTYVTCSFGGIRTSAGHLTQVTLQRHENSPNRWVGTIVSSYDQ